MSRNIVLFFLSTALLFLGLNYFASKYSPAPVPQVQIPVAPVASMPPATVAIPESPKTPETPATAEVQAPDPAQLKFDLPDLDLKFSWEGGCVTDGNLKKFFDNVDKKQNVALVKNYSRCKMFGFKVAGTDIRSLPSTVERVGPNEIVFTQVSNNIEIRRKFTFKEGGYHGHLDLEFKNVGSTPVETVAGFEMGATSEHKKSGGMFSAQSLEYQEVAYQIDDSVSRESFPFDDEPERSELLNVSGISPDWISTGSIYFTAAVLPKFKDPLSIRAYSTGFNIQVNKDSPIDRTVYEAWVEHNLNLEPGASKSFSYDLYLGPRIKSELAKYEGDKLVQSINYGFFAIIAWPLFYVIDFLNKVFNNWGVAIILVTVLIKILFYPLYKKSYMAGKTMQKLQPEMAALREKYKDDKQKQQQELMAFMRDKKANPLSGCLPILPQMPVFFALNAVFQHTFELRQAPFFLWIQDLSVMDPYYITPVILGLLMFVQQKITPLPPSVDPAQARMMQIMPVIFSVMMITFPSGLVLYMITNTVVSLVQQKYLMRKYADL